MTQNDADVKLDEYEVVCHISTGIGTMVFLFYLVVCPY